MKLVIVGFKINEENSIFYRKFNTPKELARFVEKNILKVDFASIRVIREKE